jgi:multidrug efflux pump
MNLSAPFIVRPVATTLLTIGVALAGAVAFSLLPVASLPKTDSPAISVSASMPGASPEVMASSVATPLERHLSEIADVTEMTSTSSVNSTNIQLVFGLDRDIDGAARDVQAAIVAARVDLPTDLRSNPTYRKQNQASPPILILAMTSDTLSQGQIYDAAATIVQQKLSQLEGVGNVNVNGSALPAVRVELIPAALFKYGIGLEDVRAAISAANANSPKGAIETDRLHFQIYTNDQARLADQYRPLIVAYRNGAAVRLSDIAQVTDPTLGSVENIRNFGLYNGKPSISVSVTQQPGANIIDTVDRIKALLPQIKESIPNTIDVVVANDRSVTIRASLREVEHSLLIAVTLVTLIVYLFLRDLRAAVIPAVVVPVSLIGTFGAMYLLGYTLDNLSLMALTIATGFVVDDAIVVMENSSRHIEDGMSPMRAAFQGAREVGFTVLSMSVSLIAVFVPILLMGGVVGRLFREFTITLSVAIMVSLVISLTTTPMMCARFLGRQVHHAPSLLFRISERGFDRLIGAYERTLDGALARGPLMMLILAATVGLNVYLYTVIPKGFFPQQDIGQLRGSVRADQSTSFQLMKQKLQEIEAIVRHDPAVATVVASTGGGSGGGGATNTASLDIALKPLSERNLSADQVIARLRPKFLRVKGVQSFLQASQDIRIGGRQASSQYQYTLQGDDVEELRVWSERLRRALQTVPEVTDVDSDQQVGGLETDLIVDRDTASRLGLTETQIDNTLYDAFGQRLVSTIYNPLNQYHVVMEVAPEYWQNPETLNSIYVSTAAGTVSGTQSTNAVAGTFLASTTSQGTQAGATTTAVTAASVASDTARNAAANQLANSGRGSASTGSAVSASLETMVPLAAFAHFATGKTPVSVNHQGTSVATTIAFNLPVNESLGTAVDAIDRTMGRIDVPVTIHGGFQGTAKTFQASLKNEPFLIVAALVAIYIVLGVLYESYIHPITILSTLPSAGVGALIALIATGNEFSLTAMIGVLLLIGIVKKNAIMMIDFAIVAERDEGLDARDAIRRACLLRFRPILMTTLAAVFGALPLVLATGDGTELRRPLGISIIGGLFVSQLLTLYTTPVVYLYLDRLNLTWAGRSSRRRPPVVLLGQQT